MTKTAYIKLIAACIVISISIAIIPVLHAYVSVSGYYRSDGTYVRPHVRSNPNALKYDNYSYKSTQPRYNKTYYNSTKNYNSDWYTSTKITDPYYYQGKSLYESSQPSTNLYTLPSYNYSNYNKYNFGSYKYTLKTLTPTSTTNSYFTTPSYNFTVPRYNLYNY